METLLLTIASILGMVLAIAYRADQSAIHIQSIKKEIRWLGGKNIQVSEKLLYIDKYSRSYNVSFMDERGKTYQTTCKIRRFGSKLYWTQSPDVLLGVFLTDTTPINSKERLINSLKSTFMYERKNAIANVAEIEQVDESIIHLLQKIAQSDPHKIISTAATEALQSLNRS